MISAVEFKKSFPTVALEPMSFMAPHAAPAQCDPVPTQAQINTATGQYRDYYLSAKRAASLGVSVVNASGKTDYLVIVRDYRRSASCVASDGSKVEYGQVIRAVIELSEYTTTTTLNLAFIAADATLSGKKQYFYLYSSGWFNPQISTVIAEVSGKVFDVENYALYQGIMPRLIHLMDDSGSTLAATEIERTPAGDDPAFVHASARTYAFAAVVKGMSCTDASKPFKLDQAKMAAVVETYKYLGIADCSVKAFSPAVKDRAAKLLGGVTVLVQ